MVASEMSPTAPKKHAPMRYNGDSRFLNFRPVASVATAEIRGTDATSITSMSNRLKLASQAATSIFGSWWSQPAPRRTIGDPSKTSAPKAMPPIVPICCQPLRRDAALSAADSGIAKRELVLIAILVVTVRLDRHLSTLRSHLRGERMSHSSNNRH